MCLDTCVFLECKGCVGVGQLRRGAVLRLWAAFSHLSPVSVDPLRTRPRLAGALLDGLGALLAVVGRVAVLVLAHDHTSLEAAGTRARALMMTRTHLRVRQVNTSTRVCEWFPLCQQDMLAFLD